MPAERRFKFKDLKAWGYDLHWGTIEGERAYFFSVAGEREEGETYTVKGEEYHIAEMQLDIPPNAGLLAKIVIEKGHLYLVFWLEEEEQTFPLAKEDPLKRFWNLYKDNVFTKSIPVPYED